MTASDYQFDFDLHKKAKARATARLLFYKTPDESSFLADEIELLSKAYLDLLAKRGLPPILKCHPSIQLASGAYFDFFDVAGSPMTKEDIAHALSKISRCNGHTLGDDIYSVAQHCVIGSRNAAPEIQFEVLMHDAPEFVTGDATTPLKQLLADFQKIEKSVEHEMRVRFFLPVEMSKQAKLVDLRMAATEKRDLMPQDPDGESWALLGDTEPYPEIIKPWSPLIARLEWLSAFEELWPVHQANLLQGAAYAQRH